MTEAHELAEHITEAGEHEHEHGHLTDDAFRRRIGVLIGFLACALAITTVGGSKAMKQTINANIETSDDYAFYQSKVLRQQILRAASDELNVLVRVVPNLSSDAAAVIGEREQAYRQQIQHWESDPKNGTGTKELLAKAEESKTRREIAASRDESFELAEALLEISVVLASTSVLMASRRLLATCLLFAGVGILASANGYFGFFELPFGH